MTGSAAALVSFQERSGLLKELAGVEVSVSQVQRAAEALGAEIAVDERRCVEPAGTSAATMYLGMDGTGVPMRASEVAGRTGKQPDGSAKTREANVVTVWTSEARDPEGKPVRDAGFITYSAAIESAAVPDASPTRSDFADRVLREATRRGFTEASRCVILGDGSTPSRSAAQRSASVRRILSQQQESDTLSRVSRPGSMYLHRCRRSRLQGRHRHPPETRRHAPDRNRS
jgi:hypothetical protein